MDRLKQKVLEITRISNKLEALGQEVDTQRPQEAEDVLQTQG